MLLECLKQFKGPCWLLAQPFKYDRYNLREFACLTTVILAPLRMDGGLHAGSATSLPLVRVVRLVPLARDRSMD